jgi:hypothetical protein
MRELTVGIALLMACSTAGRAQRPMAPVRGTVVDSAGHPIEDVEVTATAVGRVTRTSSEGRFQIDTVVTGPNRVLARRLGWKPIDTTFILDAKHPRELRLVMSRVAQSLDEVRIVSHDDCPTKTVEGFECRRRAGIGAFRDSADLAALKPVCAANMFQGMEGLRLVPGIPCPHMESIKGWRCLRTLVDGQVPTNYFPFKMSDYIAVEFYDEEDKVPGWYKNVAFAEATQGVATHQDRKGGDFIYRQPSLGGRPCALMMYWTKLATRSDPSLDQNKTTTRLMQARRDSIAALQKPIIDSLNALKGVKKP